MDVSSLLVEVYGRIPPLAEEAVDGLDATQLATRPAADANPIGWLVWHLARVQDHHIAQVLGTEQLWVKGSYARRFGLEPDPSNTGYGHSPGEVAAVHPEDAACLLDYLSPVAERTRTMLESLTPAELDHVVDESYDPPVTLGVRLVSVADDCLQHAGQAAYVRGLILG